MLRNIAIDPEEQRVLRALARTIDPHDVDYQHVQSIVDKLDEANQQVLNTKAVYSVDVPKSKRHLFEIQTLNIVKLLDYGDSAELLDAINMAIRAGVTKDQIVAVVEQLRALSNMHNLTRL